MPNISIIVPVYCTEKYISRCLDSILSQTYSNYDLIIVDDGSPDNCGAICDEYAKKDPRIHVIHQKNSGVSSARNTGIEWTFANSDSEWITFVDSDDWIHSDYLKHLLDAAISHNSSISCCSVTDADKPSFSKIVPPATKISPEESNYLSACLKLYKKDCFQSFRFPIGKVHEDAFIIYQITFQFSYLAKIDMPLYCYQVNPQSIMHTTWKPCRLAEFEAFENQICYFRQKKMHKMLYKTVRIYLHRICEQLSLLKRSPIPLRTKLYYGLLMRKKMRVLLRFYKKPAGISLSSHAEFYESAYPLALKIYWNSKGVIWKLFHKKNH